MVSQKEIDTSPTRQKFSLYAARDRVFAGNARQKLIDLGSLRQQNGGFSYEPDDDHESGGGFMSAEEALPDIGEKISFCSLTASSRRWLMRAAPKDQTCPKRRSLRSLWTSLAKVSLPSTPRYRRPHQRRAFQWHGVAPG